MISWLIAAGSALWFYVTGLFFIAWWRDDYSIADIGWAGGFVLLTIISLMQRFSFSTRNILVSLCVFIWATRLTLHIIARHKGEDPRYTQWRKLWKVNIAAKAYFYIFILQGFLMVIIASPVLAINLAYAQPPINILDYLGLSIWLVGYLFEAIGDWQLTRFLAQPGHKGRIMKYGLWRYTRHPNYFGEATMWWGLWISALNVPNGWLSIMSPLVITALIIFISGIPPIEKEFKDNPEYQQYKRETSPFFPWVPSGTK